MVSWEEAGKRAEEIVNRPPKESHEGRERKAAQVAEAIIASLHEDVKLLTEAMVAAKLNKRLDWKSGVVFKATEDRCELWVSATGSWDFYTEKGWQSLGRRPKTKGWATSTEPTEAFYKNNESCGDGRFSVAEYEDHIRHMIRILVAVLFRANNLPLPKE